MDSRRIDSHKLEFHPHRVGEWLISRDRWEFAKSIYPIYVEVSPVGACNHRCTFCAVDYLGYEAKVLDEARLSDTLREMGSLGVKSVMFAGEGEPLLHKQINKLVAAAPMDVAFTTNGVLLDKLETIDLCKWVKVSVNAGTRDTYAAVHRTKPEDWDRVWAGIERAAVRKKACTLGVQMVMLPENEHEVEALRSRAAAAGADYVVVKPYSQHKKSINRLDWKPVSVPRGSGKLIVREAAIATTEHAYEKCSATPFFWAYVMASGEVYSCSAYLGDERFRLGNINEATFREIWEGERRRENLRFVKDELDIHECRVNCRMDKANRYLAGFDTIEHTNFI